MLLFIFVWCNDRFNGKRGSAWLARRIPDGRVWQVAQAHALSPEAGEAQRACAHRPGSLGTRLDPTERGLPGGWAHGTATRRCWLPIHGVWRLTISRDTNELLMPSPPERHGAPRFRHGSPGVGSYRRFNLCQEDEQKHLISVFIFI